jgi:AraC family transcriptional regulator, regulatory protein of adaptative response / methylphosphotriester-DNA alkyltransferase methyltransferase
VFTSPLEDTRPLFLAPAAPASSGESPRDGGTLGGIARRRVLFHEAAEVIRRDYADPDLTVDGLARAVFSSRRQLQRAFTEAGTTVRAYIFEVRMRRAAELLQAGEHPVSRVSRMVGYRQPAQFAKAFSRRYGVPPSRFGS